MNVMIKMTVDAWVSVADNPKQRDTARHAQKAVNKHLKSSSPVQSVVHAGKLPTGEMFKIDGHTRALLWSENRLAKPSHVDVVVYPCADIAEVIALYDAFDNPTAADSTPDNLHSAFRLAGHLPQCDLLKEGAVVSALRLLHWSVPNLVPVVAYWIEEFVALDKLGLSRKTFACHGIAAALLILREYGEAGERFIIKVAANDGYRADGKSCGVDEACRLLLEAKGKSRQPAAVQRALVGKLVACCTRWLNGRMSERTTKGVDISQWMTQHDIWSITEIMRGQRSTRRMRD